MINPRKKNAILIMGQSYPCSFSKKLPEGYLYINPGYCHWQTFAAFISVFLSIDQKKPGACFPAASIENHVDRNQ